MNFHDVELLTRVIHTYLYVSYYGKELFIINLDFMLLPECTYYLYR